MSTVQQLESAVRQLNETELVEFRKWFVEYDALAWDDQFERDAAAGRLDALADAAINDKRNGKCRPR